VTENGRKRASISAEFDVIERPLFGRADAQDDMSTSKIKTKSN
jgi:hypothetical protein